MRYQRRRGLGSRRGGKRGGGGSGGGDGGDRGSDAGGGRSRAERIVGSSAFRWGVTAVLIVAFFGTGYLVAAEWLFSNGRDDPAASLVQVPDLVGLTSAEARDNLERLGLDFRVRAEMPHPRAEEGAVLTQDPLPTQFARPGAPVAVSLSLGPELRRVPDVRGLSGRQASIVLERLGFRPSVDSVQSRADRGRVVGTSPEPGSELRIPADVRLVVSQGPRVTSVPDLEGRHVNDVSELLSTAGLRLGRIAYDPEAFEAPGRVIGQSPPAGYSLRSGGGVSVRVAGDRNDLESVPERTGTFLSAPRDSLGDVNVGEAGPDTTSAERDEDEEREEG